MGERPGRCLPDAAYMECPVTRGGAVTMKLGDAGLGHIVLGLVLAVLSLALSMVVFATQVDTGGAPSALSFAIFFSGVWGGVEIGRYVEAQRRGTTEEG